MSRAKNMHSDAHPDEQRKIATFLRELAARAEQDPALAAAISSALTTSGLIGRLDRTPPHRRSASTPAPQFASEEAPDPFVIMRAQGEEALRAVLASLTLPALRQIVRRHRLDPARISARWTARDRVIQLIVDQVNARMNHGKAFSHV